MANITSIPEIIGLPPLSGVNDAMVINSMPQMIIQPCETEPFPSRVGFKLQPVWKKYADLLKLHGYSYPYSNSLKVAFLADNFPTDSFQNTYSESFFSKVTDIISSGVFETQQVLGTRSLTGIPSAALGALGSLGGGFETFAKGAGKVGGEVAQKAKDAYKKFVNTSGAIGEAVNSRVATLKSLLNSGRLDFPMIWKNSAFSPSYTVTVRLYNPVPSSIEHRKKYIIGPLASLLLLGLPQTEDGTTYRWPFFHKVEVPGLLQLHSAYIGNITVVKGGDQQQIAFNQTMGMVDVRIEFGSLFDSMVVGKKYKSKDRPTLENYLKTMEGSGKPLFKTRGEALATERAELIESQKQQPSSNAARNPQAAADMSTEPESRVSVENETDSEKLEVESPIEKQTVNCPIQYPRPVGCDKINYYVNGGHKLSYLEEYYKDVYLFPCNSTYTDKEILRRLKRGESV